MVQAQRIANKKRALDALRPLSGRTLAELDRWYDLCGWLESAPSTPEAAYDAHERLVTIHPFIDGNGRTSRLLMNLF